jgi:hypothetical protein
MSAVITKASITIDCKQALETRVIHNQLQAKRLKEENERLTKAIGVIASQQKSCEIKERLSIIVDNQYKFVEPPLDSVRPVLDNCRVVLEHRLTPGGVLWYWKLVFPEEYTGGRHRKVLPLNTISIMPAYCTASEELVSYFVEKKLIDQEII